jgi:hyperosmotically inducible protein
MPARAREGRIRVRSAFRMFRKEYNMKSTFAIALIAAGGLLAPAGVFAEGTKSTTQTTTTTQPATKTERAKEAVDDAWITSKVKAEFAKEKGVSATHIKVDTDHGVVSLSGTARTKGEVDRAMSIAQGTKGVVSVNNNIQVASAAK